MFLFETLGNIHLLWIETQIIPKIYDFSLFLCHFTLSLFYAKFSVKGKLTQQQTNDEFLPWIHGQNEVKFFFEKIGIFLA